MIAREDAEAARVDGKGLMQAELGREVGDAGLGMLREGPGVPGVLGVHVGVEGRHDPVVKGEVLGIALGGVQLLLVDFHQELDRVMVDALPELGVHAAEQRLGLRGPGPPHVMGQFAQAL
ncbi:hypothetical protein D3C87_704080 [compost metagenome]